MDGLSSECENGKVEHSIAMGKRQKEKKEEEQISLERDGFYQVSTQIIP